MTSLSLFKDITDAEFVNEIQNYNGLIVLEFYRTSCSSCMVFEPVLNKLAEMYKGQAKFLRLNTDTGGTFHYKRLAITGDPTTYVFYNGKPEGFFTGAALEKYFFPIMDGIFTDLAKRYNIQAPVAVLPA